MKRFWREARAVPADGGWRIELDGRPVRTAGGKPQVVPSSALAAAMAAEWSAQGEEIDPGAFPLRDLADYALDIVAPDSAAAVATLLAFAETDTLCYRAEPDEGVAIRQREVWEPLLKSAEARHAARFERVTGVIHRAQPAETIAALRRDLEGRDAWALAALQTLASLAASLVVALAALEPGADAEALWLAASLEEEWQAERWGRDAEAEDRRARRAAEFAAALRFAALARER